MLSCVWLFVTPWTVACQAPLSMGLSQQEYWSGLPFPPPWSLPGPRIEPVSCCSFIGRQILHWATREAHVPQSIAKNIKLKIQKQLLLNVLAFNIWLLKREKRTMKGEGYQPFKFPRRLQLAERETMGRDSATTAADHSAIRRSTSNQSTDPQYLEDKVLLPTLAPKAVCKQLQEHTSSCLPGTGSQGWVTASVPRSETDHNFTIQTSPDSCKPSVDSRVPKILTSDRFCQ